MICAVARDFVRLPGVDVVVLQDKRLGARLDLAGCRVVEVESADDEWSRIGRLAANSDWTVIIAPEIDHLLLERCRHVERMGGRLLSPGSNIVQWTSDKCATAERLSLANIPVPQATLACRGQPPAEPGA